MTTRSGKIYSSMKCCETKNNVYYRNEFFNNLCSVCYSKTVPKSVFEKKIKKNLSWKSEKYEDDYLKNFINERRLDDNNHIIKSIKLLILNNLISNKNGLDALQKIITISYSIGKFKGLTAKQAGNIMMDYRNKFGSSSIYEKINPHLQHLLCGLVFDYWNINQNEMGPVGYCYYADWGKKPLKYREINIVNNILEAPFTYGINKYVSSKSKYNRWCIDGFNGIKIKLNM
jgi:hypothetical protein